MAKYITVENDLKDNLQAGNALLHKVAVDSVNKYAKLKRITNSQLNEIVETSMFQEKLDIAQYYLSKNGKGLCLANFWINGKPYIEVGLVQGDTKIQFGKILDVRFAIFPEAGIKETFKFYSVERQVFFRFRYDAEKDTVMGSKIFLDNKGTIRTIAGTEVDYKLKEVPVVLLKNNSLGIADIPEDVRPLLHLFNYLVDVTRPEFEKAKQLLFNNKNYNSEQSAESILRELIKFGKSGHDIEDIDGKIANAIQFAGGDGKMMAILESYIGWVESKILSFSLQFRDHGGKESNRTDTSLLLMNQQAFEYMTKKIDFQERQLNRFFTHTYEMLGVEETNRRKVSIEVSPFEQWRIDTLQADADLKVAQAEQAKGIAAKNNSESAALDAGVAKPLNADAVKTDLQIDGVKTITG